MNATNAQIEKAMVKVKMLKAVRKCNRSDFNVMAEKDTDESKVQGSKVWKSHPRNVYSHDCTGNVHSLWWQSIVAKRTTSVSYARKT